MLVVVKMMATKTMPTKTMPELTFDIPDVHSNSTTIQLKSKDNKCYQVDIKCASISRLVHSSLENDAEAQEVPILSVEGLVLEKVVTYMNHHKGTEPPIVEKPLRSKDMKIVCADSWDAEFIDNIGENRQLLYDIILAANYMDIKGLLHLGCAKVASLIKGQPLEKIQSILGKDITNDQPTL